MKRKFKRIASLVLAAVMVFAMAMPGMTVSAADTTYTIEVNDTDPGHNYRAYQIFTGVLSDKADAEKGQLDNVLSDPEWGTGITTDGKAALYGEYYSAGAGEPDKEGNLEALAEAIAKANDAQALAKLLVAKGNLDTSKAIEPSGNGPYTFSNLAPGYYIILDEASTLDPGDAYSNYIVRVTDKDTEGGKLEVTPKKEKPQVDKQVQDNTDDKTKDSSEDPARADTWGETADHDINEKFSFKLKATVNNNADFRSYETYLLKFWDEMTAGVTFDGDIKVTIAGKDYTAFTANYKTEGNGDDEYTGDIAAANGQAGVKWSLEISDLKAAMKAIGAEVAEGDDIVVEVTYSAHLNENAEVPAQDGTDGAYNNNKVKLEYSNNPNTNGTGETKEDTVFVFTYELAPQKQDGKGSAVANAEFKLFDSEEDGNEIYLAYDETDKSYYPVNVGPGATIKTTADNGGRFTIKGLDEGTYYLEETKAPDGYNQLNERVKFTIAVDEHKENGDGAVAHSTWHVDGKDTIVNQSGATLPETGGIGTTIFYVVGSVLVLGAVILLVTKRRMKAD